MTTNELLERCHKLVREEWSDDTKNEIARRIYDQIEPLHHSRRDMEGFGQRLRTPEEQARGPGRPISGIDLSTGIKPE
ncbi:hypothetical protein LCGC14_2984750 [marine sediment metagenome]|uniref:Uncharacterized protein n=1 Tax=marine sediment metagenome TaxID=412755 RepID=A0A0F8XT59_9ZZZZ